MKKRKLPPSTNKSAKSIQHISKDENKKIEVTFDGKNAAAVALGRLGGLKGGDARAKALTAKRRSEIAKKAADVRWGNRIL